VTDTSIGSPPARFVHGRATWYGWLLVGAYIYLLNVQGNVVPFLQAEFALSYAAVSVHSSAMAVGVIVVGLFGERLANVLGRRKTLWVSMGGLAAGAILLCLAPAPWVSITACFVLGSFGTLVPAIVPALLADIHGERRAVAFAGLSIVAYVFGLAAPLLSGISVSLGLGWRPAVLIGAGFAIGFGLWFRRTPLTEAAATGHDEQRTLPAAFWAYWALTVLSCGLEYCMLFYAPTFLERVIGFSPATAATAAAAFPLGMLAGRSALGMLVQRVAPRRLLFGALAIVVLGFLAYWGSGQPVLSVAGLFIAGLGIAPLYPLVVNFGLGAAGKAKDLGSVRLSIAAGISLLLAPIGLGALADSVGLGPAHLILPMLVGAAAICFLIAETLQKRSAAVAVA